MSGGPQDPGESDGEISGSIDDVFAILGDETRIEILLELAEVAHEEQIGSGLSFSALRDRVGVTDSGRFNYHLNKLTDRFVTRHDEEYVARWPALMLISAIHAGLYDDTSLESERATTEFTCSACLDPLEVRFVEGTLGTGVEMHCEEHGTTDGYWFPPGARTGRSALDAARVGYTRMLTNVRLARQGVCMECWGRVSTEYTTSDDLPWETTTEDDTAFVRAQCERCWNGLTVPLRTYVLTHPVVEAAFARRGHERLEAADMLTTERVSYEETVTTEGPPQRTVRITLDEETVVMSVDEECSVHNPRLD
jgi:hypothetical protein